MFLGVFGTVSVHEEGSSAEICVCCVAAFWHVWRSGVSSCVVWCFGTVVGVFCGVVCGVLVCVWVFGWLKRSNLLLCSWVCVLAVWWCPVSARRLRVTIAYKFCCVAPLFGLCFSGVFRVFFGDPLRKCVRGATCPGGRFAI